MSKHAFVPTSWGVVQRGSRGDCEGGTLQRSRGDASDLVSLAVLRKLIDRIRGKRGVSGKATLYGTKALVTPIGYGPHRDRAKGKGRKPVIK